jgi:hypothetical protein
MKGRSKILIFLPLKFLSVFLSNLTNQQLFLKKDVNIGLRKINQLS